MTLNGWLQIALFFGLLLLTVKPLGRYMTDVFEGKRTFLSFLLRPIERAAYWICGVRESEEQSWIGYGVGIGLAGVLVPLERFGPVLSSLLQYLVEYAYIFESAIHTLSIERHHSMCCITY